MSAAVQRGVASILVVLSLSLLLVVAPASAADGRAGFGDDPRVKAYLETLKASGCEIDSVGVMFEVLVRHDMATQFPAAQYEIVGGIEYNDRTGQKGQLFQTLGELDVVILRRTDGQAVFIGEAKFWRDLPKGLKKAREQLARFRKNLQAGTIGSYHYKPDPARPFADKDFLPCAVYEFWGPRGAKAVGFEHELNLTIEEGNWLVSQAQAARLGRRPGVTERFRDLWRNRDR